VNLTPQYDDKNRGKATQRALKMAKLFKEEVWQPIMVAVDSGNKASFDIILLDPKVGLTQTEADWLWNYLKHTNDKIGPSPPNNVPYWSPIPEAASTGW